MKIQLQTKSILDVSLKNCDEPFFFFVNDEIFQTSNIIADLISKEVCQIHSVDPTFNKYTINTYKKGDFQLILNLTSFDLINVPDSELLFIEEISKILNNDSIIFFDEHSEKLQITNVMSLIQYHEKFPLYSKLLEKEINFLASNLFELSKDSKSEFLKISKSTLEKIFSSPNLVIKSEDQLLSIINKLYRNDKDNSYFYEYVLFSNISPEKIKKFFNNFDINYLTNGIWIRISERMEKRIDINDISYDVDRYKIKFTEHLDLIKNKKYLVNNQPSIRPPPPLPPPPPPLPPPPPPPPPPPSSSTYLNQNDDYEHDYSTDDTSESW